VLRRIRCDGRFSVFGLVFVVRRTFIDVVRVPVFVVEIKLLFLLVFFLLFRNIFDGSLLLAFVSL